MYGRYPKLDGETEKSFESFSVASSQERACDVHPNEGIAKFSCDFKQILIPTSVVLLFQRHAPKLPFFCRIWSFWQISRVFWGPWTSFEGNRVKWSKLFSKRLWSVVPKGSNESIWQSIWKQTILCLAGYSLAARLMISQDGRGLLDYMTSRP